MPCFCGILCRVPAPAAPANQKPCRICGSTSRNRLYPNNHHSSIIGGCLHFSFAPKTKKNLEKVGFSFGLLGVLFRLDSKLFRLCQHVCTFHCTCAKGCSRRSLYSTLFFRLLLGLCASVKSAYKAM